MATFTVFNAAPESPSLESIFRSGVQRVSSSDTTLIHRNTDLTMLVIRGVGMTYDGSGMPTGGTVTTVELFDPSQTIPYAALTDVSFSLTALFAQWIPTLGFPPTLFTGGNDTFFGSDKNDDLASRDGDDTISTGIGTDYVDPGRGNDIVDGGAGDNDQISFSSGNADPTITQGITVDLNAPTLTDPWGFTDTISGIEAVRSTRFADTLIGTAGNNGFTPLAGNDVITGGAGIDLLRYEIDANYQGGGGVTVNLATGAAIDGFGDTDTFTGIERVRGTQQADTLIGGDLPLIGTDFYELSGLGGDDILKAGKYDAFILPGAGNDTITGGAGLDQVSFEEYTGTTGVVMNLATGVIADPYGGTDSITGVEGARGTRNADTFTGDGANNFFRGLAGDDTMAGGSGIDQLRYDFDAQFGATEGVVVNLATGTATDGFGDTDTFTSIEHVRGSERADTLIGGDAVLSNGNSYELLGRGGDDTLIAGKHDAFFVPAAGNDTITGGAGLDQVSFEEYAGAAGAVINLATGIIADPYGNTDSITGVEGVRGTRNADTVTGDREANFFRGLAGNDIIDGGLGMDQVRYDRDASFGGTKGVTVNLAAGTATDGFGDTDTLTSIEAVRGSEQADTLIGGDTALGIQYNYELLGQGGADILTAGKHDTFFLPGADNDTITGGTGLDQVSYQEYSGANGAVINLATGVIADPYGNADSITGVEGVRGTRNADTIIGGDGDNFIRGLGGHDIIDGGLGTDQVRYDVDLLFGGAAGVTVDLTAGTAIDGFGTTDALTSIENVLGTQSNDTITGSAADNQLSGGLGDDSLIGLAGNDVLDGGSGQNSASFTGIRGATEIRYNPGDFSLTVVGPDGIDTLSKVQALNFSDRTTQAFDATGVRHLVNVSFPTAGIDRFMIGDAYAGPVPGLSDEFIFPTSENINIASTLPSAFIRTGAGNDAITVFSGRNVIDAFTGSNFLTGGTGQDTFFVDARGGGATWDTIVNFGVGDEVTLWGFVDGVSTDGAQKAWHASDGTAGYTGLTVHAKLDGSNVGASITFAGTTSTDITSFAVATGVVAGNPYLQITRI